MFLAAWLVSPYLVAQRTLLSAVQTGALVCWILLFWGNYILPDAMHPIFFGYQSALWLMYWGVYQSMIHFYYDGFLWKMRKAAVRANI